MSVYDHLFWGEGGAKVRIFVFTKPVNSLVTDTCYQAELTPILFPFSRFILEVQIGSHLSALLVYHVTCAVNLDQKPRESVCVCV